MATHSLRSDNIDAAAGHNGASVTAALDVADLRVEIRSAASSTELVLGIDLQVGRGECVALVGESGSGKSLTGLAVMGLLDRNMHATAERFTLGGRSVSWEDPRQMRDLRGRVASMVFQDPMNCLNPVMKIGTQISETFHPKLRRRQSAERAVELLEQVRIREPRKVVGMYPHQLSGGMRQRVMIAIALANDPELIIADEPTTALDVSTQAQVLDVLVNVTSDESRALLLISHDLGVVSAVADRVYVMYQGEIVEQGPTTEVLQRPQHHYTQGLLKAVPRLTDPSKGRYAL